MPILFAPLLGFALGVAFSWVAREDLARDSGPLVIARPVVVGAAYAALVYAPVVGYFVAFHADWAYLYLVPRARVPSAVDLALVLLSGALVPIGAMVAASPARARRSGAVGWLVAVPLVAAAGLFAWGARRLAVSASYAQFRGGFGTVPLLGSTLGNGVLWMGLCATLGIAWSVRILDRRARGKR